MKIVNVKFDKILNKYHNQVYDCTLIFKHYFWRKLSDIYLIQSKISDLNTDYLKPLNLQVMKSTLYNKGHALM